MEMFMNLMISLVIALSNSSDYYTRNLPAEAKVEMVSVLLNEDPSTMKGIMWVESRGDVRAHGDKHMIQQAYGMFQMRQPAVTDVNRYYGLNFTMNDIRDNAYLQTLYAVLYLKHIRGMVGGDETKAIQAYNAGVTNTTNGFTNSYPDKVDNYRAKYQARADRPGSYSNPIVIQRQFPVVEESVPTIEYPPIKWDKIVVGVLFIIAASVLYLDLYKRMRRRTRRRA